MLQDNIAYELQDNIACVMQDNIAYELQDNVAYELQDNIAYELQDNIAYELQDNIAYELQIMLLTNKNSSFNIRYGKRFPENVFQQINPDKYSVTHNAFSSRQ